MKTKILVLVAALMTLTVSAMAQQDPLDWGAPDSLILQFTHTPNLQNLDSVVTVEVIVVNDSLLGSVGPGLQWRNSGMRMTSGSWSVDGMTAFDGFRYLYYRNKIDSTNASQLFQCVGLRSSEEGGLAPGRTQIVTYNFKLTAAVDTVVIDSGMFQPFSFVTAGNTEFVPRTNLPIKCAVPQDVRPIDNGNLPTSYGLSQNYPNPFNPSTTFEYALPVASKVELSIFNVLGQKVITLINQEQPANNYQVTWDGKSDNGNPVSSGIYFYRLTAGDFVATKKMMMLK